MTTSAPSFRTDWLNDRELEVRESFRTAALVLDTNFDEDTVGRVAEVLGYQLQLWKRKGLLSIGWVTKRYPGLLLLTLVGHAATDYEQHAYWETFWERLGLPRMQDFETDTRHAVPQLLRKFQLKQFSELDGKFVLKLAMHAGIPNYCLGDIVQCMSEHLRNDREPTAVSIVEWLCEPTKEYRLNQLDVPAQNFILYGGDFALDILDRILDLLLYVSENPDTWLESSNAGELTTETTGLPSVMLNALLDSLEQLGDQVAAHLPSRRRKGRLGASPFIRLDTVEDTVEVCLPATDDMEGAARWQLLLDGEPHEVRGELGWGAAADQPPAVLAVPQPTRLINATRVGSARSYSLPLVDTQDPMLVFTNEGRLVGRQEVVPQSERVFVLMPRDHTIREAGSDLELEAIDLGVPSGWLLWRMVEISTIQLDGLRLANEQGQFVGAGRNVRPTEVPELVLQSPVTGITTVNRNPVYADRPWVYLPSHPSGPLRWQVTARRVGEQKPIAQTDYEATEPAEYDPFEDFSGNLLGYFEIRVRGPIGSDLRRIVFVAEGLKADFEPACRFPVQRGLAPATAALSSGALEFSDDRIEFSTEDLRKRVTLSNDELREQVVVSPPHVVARLDQMQQRPQWSAAPKVVTPESLAEKPIAAVRVPLEDAAVEFCALDSSGNIIQKVDPTYQEHNDSFDLSAGHFAETFADVTSGELVARIWYSQAKAWQTVTIARVRPAELFSSLELGGEVLVVHGRVDVEGLTLQLWSESAPWRPAESISIDHDIVTLPTHLRGAGVLKAKVVVDDPWAPVDPPPWPPEDAVRLSQAGWFRDQDYARDSLARFIAGEGQLPLPLTRCPEMWSAVMALSRRTSAVSQRSLREISREIRHDSRDALEALGRSNVPTNLHPSLVIASGLVKRRLSPQVGFEDVNPSPLIACLGAVADVIGGDRHETAQVANVLRYHGGARAVALFNSGTDVLPAEGVIDQSAFAMHNMPALKVEAIFEACRVVPGALLDKDTRFDAVAELFHRRADWKREPKHGLVQARSGRLLSEIKRVGHTYYQHVSAKDAVVPDINTDDYPWALVPTISLTLAFAARLIAHGRLDSDLLDHLLLPGWARMAELYPKLVQTDLLVAELIVTQRLYGTSLGEIDE